MYFALQVAVHKEKKFIEQIKKLIGNSDFCNFIYLDRELKIHRQGKTAVELQPVFAGYVFLQAEDKIPADIYQIIKKNNFFYRFLKSNHDITPLNEHDLSILQHFLKVGTTAGTSRVYFDSNDRIVVESGPLKGLEGNIIKVDKRKQRAKIQLDFENSPMILDLSFDIIAKAEVKKEI